MDVVGVGSDAITGVAIVALGRLARGDWAGDGAVWMVGGGGVEVRLG